jgi:putative membrane protein
VRCTQAAILFGAGVVATACARQDTGETTDTSATAATSTSSNASASDTAIGAPIPGHAALTDANILAEEKAGDSAEVSVATLAKSVTKDAGVRAFAQRLITDHSKGGKDVDVVIKKTAISPYGASWDTTAAAAAHALDRLKTLSGADFDTAFVNHEIADHQADITAANEALSDASNPQVKALVQKSIPELQTHLDLARKLAHRLTNAKK